MKEKFETKPSIIYQKPEIMYHKADTRYRSKRIINGILNNVILKNGKIIEVLGPANKSLSSRVGQYIAEEDEHMNAGKLPSGLQLVSEKDEGMSRKTYRHVDTEKPNDAYQDQKSTVGIHLTPVTTEELSKILSQDNDIHKEKEYTDIPILDKQEVSEQSSEVLQIPEIKVPDVGINSPQNDTKDANKEPVDMPISNRQEMSKKAPLSPVPPVPPVTPVSEPLKLLQIPETKVPNVGVSIPQKDKKDSQSKPIKLDNVANKLGNILGNTSSNVTYKNADIQKYNKVGADNKADEKIRIQPQPKIDIKESKLNKPKERRSMAEELEAELLNERKFEEWTKKQKFRENLEKAARFAEETRDQFEEKIPELSGKIEEITGEVKGVENRLDTVDRSVTDVNKSVGELCTGIDCIKTDVKKYQDSHNELEKMVQDRFKELAEKVQGLERPTFTCENCGEQLIAPLSSFCPNCGSPIHSWSDESGEPVKGWVPYWKRIGKSVPQ